MSVLICIFNLISYVCISLDRQPFWYSIYTWISFVTMLIYVIESQFVTSERLNNICWNQHICVTISRAWPCPSVSNLQKGLNNDKKWYMNCVICKWDNYCVYISTRQFLKVLLTWINVYNTYWLNETKSHLEHYQI